MFVKGYRSHTSGLILAQTLPLCTYSVLSRNLGAPSFERDFEWPLARTHRHCDGETHHSSVYPLYDPLALAAKDVADHPHQGESSETSEERTIPSDSEHGDDEDLIDLEVFELVDQALYEWVDSINERLPTGHLDRDDWIFLNLIIPFRDQAIEVTQNFLDEYHTTPQWTTKQSKYQLGPLGVLHPCLHTTLQLSTLLKDALSETVTENSMQFE